MMGMATDYPHGATPRRKDGVPEDKAHEDHAETRTGTTPETVPSSVPAGDDSKHWTSFLMTEKFRLGSELFIIVSLVFTTLVLLFED